MIAFMPCVGGAQLEITSVVSAAKAVIAVDAERAAPRAMAATGFKNFMMLLPIVSRRNPIFCGCFILPNLGFEPAVRRLVSPGCVSADRQILLKTDQSVNHY
jgi:hypothetical protein